MLLSIAILTIILSVILIIYNWHVNRNAIYLALFFIIFGNYSITHYFTVFGKSDFWLAIFYGNFSPLWFLAGPMIYFYVRGTLTDKNGISSKWDLLHFIPFIIHLIGIFPFLIKPFSEKEQIAQSIINSLDNLKYIRANWLYPSSFSFLARPALLLVYVLASFKLVWDFAAGREKFRRLPYQQFIITYRWLFILLGTSGFMAISFLVLTNSLLNVPVSKALFDATPLHFLSGLALLLMNISLLIFPQILYGMPVSKEAKKSGERIPKQKLIKETVLENEEDPFYELALQIHEYLKEGKPYLEHNFSIADIALALHVPQHHVAYCFNSIFQTKFTTMRSELRVAYAKELLINGMSETLSMDGIGHKSGFSTRSNFYNTFKSITGLTPSEYLETLGQ
jgi:AraC-like DNA-binding protein